jgi:hypothetical protein
MVWIFLSERVSHISLAVAVSRLELRFPDSSVSSSLACDLPDPAAMFKSHWSISSSYAKTEPL